MDIKKEFFWIYNVYNQKWELTYKESEFIFKDMIDEGYIMKSKSDSSPERGYRKIIENSVLTFIIANENNKKKLILLKNLFNSSQNLSINKKITVYSHFPNSHPTDNIDHIANNLIHDLLRNSKNQCVVFIGSQVSVKNKSFSDFLNRVFNLIDFKNSLNEYTQQESIIENDMNNNKSSYTVSYSFTNTFDTQQNKKDDKANELKQKSKPIHESQLNKIEKSPYSKYNTLTGISNINTTYLNLLNIKNKNQIMKSLVTSSLFVLSAIGNTSSFSKFDLILQLNVGKIEKNQEIHIKSGKINNYILDKQPIMLNYKENIKNQSFNIFYYIIKGLSSNEKEKYHLKNKEESYFKVLNLNNEKRSLDENGYSQLKESMKYLNIKQEELNLIISFLIGILFLTNVNLEYKLTYDSSSKDTIKELIVGNESLNDFSYTADLMGIGKNDLMLLVTKQVKLDKNKIIIQTSDLTIDKANENKNRLICCLYQYLFDYLLKRINSCLADVGNESTDDCYEKEKYRKVYLVNNIGYDKGDVDEEDEGKCEGSDNLGKNDTKVISKPKEESMNNEKSKLDKCKNEVKGLSELCVNYTNEKLIGEYKCLFNKLHEKQSKISSNISYLFKLAEENIKSEAFYDNAFKSNVKIEKVHHSFGMHSYNLDVKDKDMYVFFKIPPPDEYFFVMEKSKNKLVKKIFSLKEKEREKEKEKNKESSETLISLYKRQVDELIKLVSNQKTSLYYILNLEGLHNLFNKKCEDSKIKQILKESEVYNIGEIEESLYINLDLKELIDKYSIINPNENNENSNALSMINSILSRKNNFPKETFFTVDNKIKINKNGIELKLEVINELEEALKINKSSELIGSVYKSRLVRKRIKTIMNKTIAIQRCYREYINRKMKDWQVRVSKIINFYIFYKKRKRIYKNLSDLSRKAKEVKKSYVNGGMIILIVVIYIVLIIYMD